MVVKTHRVGVGTMGLCKTVVFENGPLLVTRPRNTRETPVRTTCMILCLMLVWGPFTGSPFWPMHVCIVL